MSRILVDQVRSNSASGDAITLDGSGKCAINATTINSLTFPTSDGSSDQIIKTNGSGALSFVTASGGTIGAYATHETSTSYTFTSADSYQSGVHSVTITPTKASSKIAIYISSHGKTSAEPNKGVYGKTRIQRNVAGAGASTIFNNTDSMLTYTNGFSGNRIENYSPLHPSHIVDTPSYTLGQSIVYTFDVGAAMNTGSSCSFIWNQQLNAHRSTMTVMELTS